MPAAHFPDLSGPELYLVLDEADRQFLRMFGGASFGGSVTLPSGVMLTGEQMESIRPAEPRQDAQSTAADTTTARPAQRSTARRLGIRPPTGPPGPAHRDWGVAWFGSNSISGGCERCQRHTQVYQGFNGGAHMGRFCASCRGPVLRSEP